MNPLNPDGPNYIELAERFYVRQAVDNIAWVDLGEYAVVVDALEQPELEAEVFEAIRKTLGDKPIRYVFNTHTHYDHIALNQAFQREFDAEVISQVSHPAPTEGRWYESTRRRLLMLPAPGCHTQEDILLWIPEDSALFVGDIFGWGLIPSGRLNPEIIQCLRDTYLLMIAFEPKVVIPGHGPLCSAEELKRWLEYFDDLLEHLLPRVSAGHRDDDILSTTPPPRDMRHWWRFLAWKHEDSVKKILSSARKGKW